MNMIVTAVAAAVLCAASPLYAADAGADLAAIRTEIAHLRDEYAARMRALEARLARAEALVGERAAEPAGAAAPPPVVASEPQRASAFNPAISLVLLGTFGSHSSNPGDYRIAGFPLGGEAGAIDDGFSLDESELTASASVDQLFEARAIVAFADEDDGPIAEVEEAYVDTTALPGGTGARFGRFFSAIGYLNAVHGHAWDFRDMPLAYLAFLGEQYRDDGVQVEWVLPTDLYVRIGGEVFAGRKFPAGDDPRHVFGDSHSLFVDLGGDLGASNAWGLGLSALRTAPHRRAAGSGAVLSGDATLYIVDGIWKWAPDGNPGYRNFKLQSEFLYRREGGLVRVPGSGPDGLLDYDGTQFGWYAQGVYQFMPRWRAGIRYDRLWAANALLALDLGGFTDPAALSGAAGLGDDHRDPHRWSAMLDWSPSEFSRLRLQYNRDYSLPAVPDDQVFLQYIMSLGSHGAHEF